MRPSTARLDSLRMWCGQLEEAAQQLFRQERQQIRANCWKGSGGRNGSRLSLVTGQAIGRLWEGNNPSRRMDEMGP